MNRWREPIPDAVLADLAAYCDFLRRIREPLWERVARDAERHW